MHNEKLLNTVRCFTNVSRNVLFCSNVLNNKNGAAYWNDVISTKTPTVNKQIENQINLKK